jgi:hypothetical protein
MGYKALVDSMVSNALSTIGDLANVVTLVKRGAGVYDPDTGETTPSTVSYPDITCAMPGFSAEEKDTDIIILTDKKGLIARLDLPVGVEIEKNDEIHQGSVKWDVRRILSVPGDSLYKLHLRKVR